MLFTRVQLGSLCIIDSQPRSEFSGNDAAFLKDLAHVAAHQIELRLTSLNLLETQAALEQSLERYSLAIAGANDGIWDWDITNNGVFSSKRWCEMLGIGGQDLVGTSEIWFERIHPDEKSRVSAEVFAHLAGTSGEFRSEYRPLKGELTDLRLQALAFLSKGVLGNPQCPDIGFTLRCLSNAGFVPGTRVTASQSPTLLAG